MSKKINVIIHDDGKLDVETDGFKGESCVTKIKELFDEFLEIDNFDLKSDYYEFDEKINNGVDISIWVHQLILIYV